jgi:hypothetical protein
MVREDRAHQKISNTKQENYLSALLPPFQIVSRFSFDQVHRNNEQTSTTSNKIH